MSNNSPIIEIVFLTTSEMENELDLQELPVLRVFFDGQQYLMTEGFDSILEALGRTLSNLGSDYSTRLMMRIKLENQGKIIKKN